MTINFFAAGMPSTKGSARAFVVGKRAVVVNDAGKKAKSWASVVSGAASEAMAGRPAFDVPVEVAITYYLPRPASHFLKPTRKRPNSVLRPDAPVHVASKPDGDKLDRCAWDALTGIVFNDDARIVRWTGQKLYSDDGKTGALFTIAAAEGRR